MAITYHAGRRLQAISTDVQYVQGYAGGNTPNPSGTGSGAGGGGAGGLGATPTNNVGGAGGVGSSTDIETPPVQSTDGSYTVLQFTGDATFTPSSSFNVEYLVVGGGGGGGSGSYSGGGGAGAYRTATGFGVTAQTYNITIGAGGSGRLGDSVTGGVGGSSVFSTITSVGGAGGASGHATSGASSSGASGGGGAVGSGAGGGSGSYGNNGGSGYSWGAPYLTGGGGGGGSGAAGSNGSSGSGGAGGTGTANDILISSTNVYYAGGGGGVAGGNNSSNQAGAGGNGGGGQGGKITSPSEAGRSATPNTGGGGGGGSYWAGGDGGSGVVIIRFLTSGNSYTITDGIGSVYYAGGGGGGGNSGNGAGGNGGGGQGGTPTGSSGTDGKNAGGYGSGGGGGSNPGSGGSGSNGIVIIRGLTSELSGNYSQVGGTVDTSTVAGQTIIKWTAISGTTTFTPTASFDVRYLVVGGGGGGASRYWAGGGGAGGYRTATNHAVTAQAYTIVVGAGGAVQSTVGQSGNNGSDSSALNITSIGGGGGATDNGTANNGGSGGGAGGGGGGVRGEGTTTDTKPTNVQVGSRFEETDTRKIYHLGSFPTLEDNFSSSTGWTQVINTASGVVDNQLIGLTNSQGTNSAGVWKDYGLIFDDDKFVLRCKFDILVQTGGSGNASTLYFGLSDTNGATNPHAARDGFGIAVTNYAASGMLWLYPNNATWDNADTDLSLTPTETTYYLQIARTSPTSVTFTLYNDSTFANSAVVRTHTQSIASTLNGLRYIMFQEWRNSSSNTTKVAIDDLIIYNNTSSVSSMSPSWKEVGT